MTDATTGGSVRGNDQVSIDSDQCKRSWSKGRGRDKKTTNCEGALAAVTANNGGLIGYRCSRCAARYTLKRSLIVDPPKPRSKK